MKIVKKILIGLVVLIVVLAGVGLLLPRAYKVERSVVVQAPAEVVFEQVNDLPKNEAWSPWKAADPTVQTTYGAITAGKGASSSWTSEKMGAGTMTIEESVPGSSLKVHLEFKGQGTGDAFWTFVAEGEGVKVTETMTGDAGMNPVMHYMNLAMDKMIGPYFEKGLASLKQVSEARAAALKAEAATQQAVAIPAEEAPVPAKP